MSRTLEYAFDDFALSRIARALGHNADADTLEARALNYRNIIDPSTGYANGRHADGRFLTGSNPFGFTKFITEGAPLPLHLVCASPSARTYGSYGRT